MNWINMLWAILTLLSVVVFISGSGFAQRKIRFINYVLFTFIVDLDNTGVVYRHQSVRCLAASVVSRPDPPGGRSARCLISDTYVMLRRAVSVIAPLFRKVKGEKHSQQT